MKMKRSLLRTLVLVGGLFVLTSCFDFLKFWQWTPLDSGVTSTPYSATSTIDPAAVIEISTVADLEKMRNNNVGHFKLMNDLIFGDAAWAPITMFRGTFDGNNKTIYGLKLVTATYSNYGFFHEISGATIKHLTFDNVSINLTIPQFNSAGMYKVGALAGEVSMDTSKTTIENVQVRNVTMNITNNSDRIVCVGGLIGYTGAKTDILWCGNEGNFPTYTFNNVKEYDGLFVGGLVGVTNVDIYFEHCTNAGRIGTNSGVAGGLLGRAMVCAVNITTSVNFGKITGLRAGGLVGDILQGGGEITRSYNIAEMGSVGLGGDILSAYGGLVGALETEHEFSIANAYNSGLIYGGARMNGGLIGRGEASKLTVSKCYNSGNVIGTQYSGGLVGYGNKVYVEDSINFGFITAPGTYLYALVGYVIDKTSSGKEVHSTTETAGSSFDAQYPASLRPTLQPTYAVTKTFFTSTLKWSETIWNFTGLDVSVRAFPRLR